MSLLRAVKAAATASYVHSPWLDEIRDLCKMKRGESRGNCDMLWLFDRCHEIGQSPELRIV